MSSGSKIHKSKCLPSSHLLLLGVPNWDTIYFRKPKRAHLKYEMKNGKKRDTITNIKGYWNLCITCVCVNKCLHLISPIILPPEWPNAAKDEFTEFTNVWNDQLLSCSASLPLPTRMEVIRKKREKARERGGNLHCSIPWGSWHAPIIVLLKQFRATVGLNEDLTNP